MIPTAVFLRHALEKVNSPRDEILGYGIIIPQPLYLLYGYASLLN